jgi:hypothetical protein
MGSMARPACGECPPRPSGAARSSRSPVRASRPQWLGERTHEGFGRFRLDALLPGVTCDSCASDELALNVDASEEAVAATTREWFTAHRGLAQLSPGTDRKPSLSQWFELVAELHREDENAIARRLKPTTAGAPSWSHPHAKAVLEKLKVLPLAQQEPHARLFVRWLRAHRPKGET